MMGKLATVLGTIIIILAATFGSASAASSWSKWKSFTGHDKNNKIETAWKYRTRWADSRSFEFQIRVFSKPEPTVSYTIKSIYVRCSNDEYTYQNPWLGPDGPDRRINGYAVGKIFSHKLDNLCEGNGTPEDVQFTAYRHVKKPSVYDDNDGF